MRPSARTHWPICLILFALAACSVQVYARPSPTPTERARRTRTPAPASATAALASPSVGTSTATLPVGIVPTAIPQVTSSVAAPVDFCTDGQAPALIASFKSALLTSNGVLLASLVSPAHGMDARLFRDGRVVNYDQAHAKFLFETTFVVDWGLAPASGLDTKGSFHELIVPALLDVFNKTYTLNCNHVQVGGTTYQASWPYPGINFYAVYYPGSQTNGYLDWHTWLLGMEYVSGRPYLYAIMQFQWEP